mgnify:CR=1 FL=1
MVGKLFAYFLIPLLLLLGTLAFSVIILEIGIVLIISLLWWAIDNIWMIGLFALFLILIIKG